MAYNTTPFHGKKVRLEKNGVIVDYNGAWSISVTLDIADASRFGQEWKEGIPGMASWNGQMEFQFVPGNAEQIALYNNILTATPGTKVTDVKFLLDVDTNAFTGNIFITGLSINPTLGDVVKCSCTFVGDGQLTLTNAA